VCHDSRGDCGPSAGADRPQNNGPEVGSKQRKMNIYTLKIKGDWNIAKGRLRQKYATLTDDVLQYVEGHENELLQKIELASGASRQEIESFLSDERNFRMPS
jgi:uncharacterized protein YjbJ (UPF0337 family)